MDKEPEKGSESTPEVPPEPPRVLYQVTVQRRKGQPVRPAYSYNVKREGHEDMLVLEGTRLMTPDDVPPVIWEEIQLLASLGILYVAPYVDAKNVEPDPEYTEAAEKARKAIDAGEMSGPFPDTADYPPPPPRTKVRDPIKTEKPDWEQAQKEMLEQLGRPAPVLHDAVTGEQTGGPEEKPPDPEVEEPVEDPTPEPEPEEKPKKRRRRRRK